MNINSLTLKKSLSFTFGTTKLIQCIVISLNEPYDKSFKTVKVTLV